MPQLWRLMAEYDAETTTFTAAAGGAKASPFRADFNGRLIGLRSVASRDAATSLTNHVQWKLDSTTFVPNSVECGSDGSGLQTAPAFQSPPQDWPMDQEVLSSIDINIQARNITADTPVTNNVLLYGLFDVA